MPNDFINRFLEVHPEIKPVKPDTTNTGLQEEKDNYYNELAKKSQYTPIGEYSPLGYKTSKYDTDIIKSDIPNLEEIRAERQPALDKLSYGIIKGTGLAATTFATTFTSLPYGILSALDKGDASKIYDNPISNAYDKFNKNMEEQFPNYYTEKERNADAFSPNNWFTVNFLADKIIKNTGFTVGAIAGGGLTSKALGSLGKLAMSGKYIKELEAVNNLATSYIANGLGESQAFVKALSGVGSTIRLVNGVQTTGAVLISAGTEATIEALQTKQDTKNKILQDFQDKHKRNPTEEELNKIEDYSSSAGNIDYLMNLFILGGSNYVQFGRILSGMKNERKALLNGISRSGDTYVAEAIPSITKVGIVLKSPITESFEEGSQFLSQEASKDYWSRKYDNNARSTFADKLKSIGQGFEKTFGTKEGLESMLLGFITGGIFSGITGSTRRELQNLKQAEKNTINTVNDLNNYTVRNILSKNEPLINTAVRGESISRDMDEYIKSGDVYNYNNLQHDLFKNYILSRITAGKSDLIVEELNTLKELSKEEFEKTWGIDPSTNNKKTTSAYIDDLIKEAEKLTELKQNLDLRFPTLSNEAKVYIWEKVSNLDNIDNRLSKINTKISKSVDIYNTLQTYLQNSNKENLDNLNKVIYDKAIELENTGENAVQLVTDYIKLINDKKNLADFYKKAITVEGKKNIQEEIEKTEKKYYDEITQLQENKLANKDKERKNDRINKIQDKQNNKDIYNIANKIVNRKDNTEQLTSGEQQIYDNNTQAIEQAILDILGIRDLRQDEELNKLNTTTSSEEEFGPPPSDLSIGPNGAEPYTPKNTISLWHGGLEFDFNIDQLDVTRLAQKQQKKGRTYAGFYLYDETSKKGAESYSSQTGKGLHRFEVDKNSKILELNSIERVTRKQLREYKEQGYDLLKSKDVRGRVEYILLNKDIVKDVINEKEEISNPFINDFNLTLDETEELNTNENTGYIDTSHYSKSIDNNINNIVNSIDNELIESNIAKTTDTDGNLEFIENKKLIQDGYNATAYLSREYNIIEVEDKKLINEKNNELNPNIDSIILSPAQFNIKDEVELVINENYSGDITDPSNINNTIKWGTFLDQLKNKYGINYKDSIEFIDNVPINYKYKGNLLTHTSLHNVSWINPKNVYGDLELDRNNLRKIRKYIIEKGGYSTTILEKSYGKLFKLKEKNTFIPLTEATTDPNINIAVYSGDQFRIARGSSESSFIQANIINKKKIEAGTPVMIVEVNKDKFLAIPIRKQKIGNSEYKNDIKDSIATAINIYLNNDVNNIFAKNILQKLKLDITSEIGLEKYITQFINNYNTNKQDLNKIHKELNISTDQSIFNINGNNIAFKHKGAVYYIAKGIRKRKDLFFNKLDEALDNMYLHTNIESIASNKTIEFVNREPILYKEFNNDTSLSNIKGFQTSDGKYTYTVQKVIRLDYSDILKKKRKRKIENEFEKTQKAYNSLKKLIEIGQNNSSNLQKLKKLEEKLSKVVISQPELKETSLSDIKRLIRTANGAKPITIIFKDNTRANVNPLYRINDEGEVLLLSGNMADVSTIKEVIASYSEQYTVSEPKLTLNFDLDQFSELPFTNLSLLPLTDEQIGILKKSSENISVPGLDIFKQLALVNFLTRSIINTMIDNNIDKIDTEVIYNIWKDNLEENRNTLKEWLSIDENKSNNKYKSFEKLFNSLDSALKGWNIIISQSLMDISKINGFRHTNNINLDEEELLDSERFDYDKSSLEKNSEVGLSARVKRLLSSIDDIDKNGNPKKNWLGEIETVDYRIVYSTFQQWTTDMSYPIFDDMLLLIKSHENEFSWVPNAIKKLEGISDQNKKAFVNDMINHYFRPIKVMWDKKDEKGGYTVNLQYPSKLASVDILLNKWKANFINSSLIKLHEGEYVFNTINTKKVLSEFLQLKDKKDLNIDDLKYWLNNFNITLEDKAWEELSKGNFRIENININLKNILSSSYSPFVVLNNSINKLKENKELSDSNPFDNTSVQKLARFNSKFLDNLYSQMIRTAGKAIYPFNKNTYISNRILELVKGDKLDELSTLPFNKHSYWIKIKDTFKKNISIAAADLEVLKQHGDRTSEDNQLHELSSSDYEQTVLGLLHSSQEDKSGNNKRIISLLYPTQSDKSRAIILSGIPEFEINYDIDGNIQEDTLDKVYTQLVLPEIERIIHFQKLTDSGKTIDIEGLSKGWNKFYFIPSLNNLKNVFKKGRLNPNIQETSFKNNIKEELKNHINILIKDKITDWTKYGFINEENEIEYIDNKFVKQKILSKGIQKDNKEAIIKAIATDTIIQYLVGNANTFMTMIYDPANAYKSKSEDSIQQIEDTFINIGKRLASDIAPGSETEDNNNGKYWQAFVSDRALDSINLEQLDKLLGSKLAKEYTKNGTLKEGTNAQEFITLTEQIKRYYYEGKIDKNFADNITDTVEREVSKGNHNYTNNIIENLNKINPEFGKEFTEMIFQVEKPVYVGNKVDTELQHEIRYYIKTSAYALTPELTMNSDIDNIRIAMEKQGINRLAFSSGIKLGNFNNPIQLWNEDGIIKNYSEIDFTNSKVLLERSGFRIQQLVPYDENKKSINRVSQASKNLFLNLHKVEGFKYQGKEYTGKQLEKEYHNLYKKIFDIQKNEFADEIGYDLKKNRFINQEKSIDNIRKILILEAQSRNYSINDINAIELDKSLKLLAFNSSAQRLESLLNSIVQNRVLKLMIPGKSFVLSTEEGYQTKITQRDLDNNKGIIYTSNWTGKLLPQRIENGIVKPSQVLVPFKFRDNKGKLLNIEDFVDKKTGLIDNNKLPDDLRQIFGMRISNQGLNLQSYIEIVGFLPHNAGDICVATRDYLVQMSSDFDMDKLYTYMYNTFYTKFGKLERFNKSKQVMSKIVGKESDEITPNKKELLNSILDIHIAIHSNSNKVVQKQISTPLGSWDFEDIAKRIEKSNKNNSTFSPLSDKYQQTKRLNAATGKALVGMFTNLSMFNAVAQSKSLYFVDGYDENHNEIPFNIRFGDKISNGKIAEESIIGNNNTYISDVISGGQSCAVDNEKLQVCDKLGWSSDSFKYIAILQSLGFGSESALFTAQPIIKEYFERIKSERSSIKPFVADLNTKVLEELKDDVKSKIKNFNKNTYSDKYSDGKKLSSSNMWKVIEEPEKLSDLHYIELSSLEQLQKLELNANILSSVMSSINVDSKGIDKNMLESINKYDNVIKNILNSNSNLINVKKLLENNINSYATEILKFNNDLWNNIMPYNKSGVRYYFDKILEIIGKQESSIKKKAIIQKQIFDDFKSYLFTKQDLGLTDKELLSERNRLFIEETNLANVITNLQKEDKWKNHPFIGKLYFEINKNGLPSIVKINAAREDIVEKNTLMGAYDLLLNDRPLGEVNKGETPNISAKGKMTFSYGNNKRSDVKSLTTFDAIKNGERVATTRYESDGRMDYWKSLKEGDIIEWEGSNNDKILVKVTKPLHKLIGSDKTAEQWSKLEGWSVDYFNNKVKSKIGKAWQIEYTPIEAQSIAKVSTINYTTRELMQDLILASYISGGIQQATQYLKYIPAAYINTIPFAERLSNMLNLFSDSEFMQISSENSEKWDIPSFIVQYFQHNSDKIKRIIEDDMGNLTGIKRLITKNKILEKFSLLNEENPPIFLTVRDKFRKKGLSKNYLYIHQGEILDGKPVYTRINNLGYNDFKEYNSNISKNTIAKSIIEDNNTNNNLVRKEVENKERGFSRTYVQPSIEAKDVLEIQNGTKETLNNILENISANEDVDPYYRLIARTLYDKYDENIKLDTNFNKGRGAYLNNIVYINPSSDNLNDLSNRVLHEVIHSIINPKISLYEQNKFKGTSEQFVALTRLKNIYTSYKDKLLNENYEDFTKFSNAYSRYSTGIDEKANFTLNQLSKYYGGLKLIEFITMCMTDKKFQQILNDISYNDSRTWLEKIFDEMVNTLSKFIGVTINKGSSLEVALHDILSLVENKNYEIVNTKESTNVKSLLPKIKSKLDILEEFGELNKDGSVKLVPETQEGFITINNRVARINKGQNLYKAVVSKTAGEGTNVSKTFFKIVLEERNNVSLLQRMNLISNEEVERRIKLCK